MFGFYNRLLEIDMNKRSFAINPIPDEVLCGTLGGKGLATHQIGRAHV